MDDNRPIAADASHAVAVVVVVDVVVLQVLAGPPVGARRVLMDEWWSFFHSIRMYLCRWAGIAIGRISNIRKSAREDLELSAVLNLEFGLPNVYYTTEYCSVYYYYHLQNVLEYCVVQLVRKQYLYQYRE